MEISLGQLAQLVNGVVEGDSDIKINNYSKIEEGEKGCLTFLANPKYEHYIYDTNASAVLVSKDFKPAQQLNVALLRVDDPYSTLANLLNFVSKQTPEKKGVDNNSFIDDSVALTDDIYIGAFAYIGKNVKLGNGTKIYPQCYVGDNVEIGDNVILYPGVKIYHGCKIGNGCIIHAGAVIGADGFGFAPNNGEYVKIAQIGNVVLEDNVEIGANTAIDRATMGSTIIKAGVKLDNLIQIGHNVEIGENTVMAAQVGVAGSTKIGKHNMVGGQVGFAGHIKFGDNNMVGAQSGIPNNIGSGNLLMGSPVVNSRDYARQTVYIKNLGNLNKEMAELKKKLSEIEKLLNK